MTEKECFIKQNCERFQTMFENYKKSLTLLKTLKEKSERQETQLHEQINENHRLKVRAAVAWEELTPRPSFKDVNKEHKIFYYLFLSFSLLWGLMEKIIIKKALLI